jgi:hypothetical protein
MTSIQIAQLLAKVDYAQGDTLVLDGLRIVGVWEGFPAEELSVTMSDITGYNTNNVGIQHITVTKNMRSANFDVEVMTLTSILVDKPPTKTDYKAGEPLDLTGIMVYGNYTGANPIKKMTELIPIERLTISGYEPNRVGRQQRVTITVRGQNANFFVNIEEAAAPQRPGNNPPTTQAPETPPANTTPTVTSVAVSPSSYSTKTNTTVQLGAAVTGTNNPGSAVTWKVSSNATGTGEIAPRTTINASGLLTVAPNEWSPTLYVFATSTVDPTKYGIAVVTITNNNDNSGSNQGA